MAKKKKMVENKIHVKPKIERKRHWFNQGRIGKKIK